MANVCVKRLATRAVLVVVALVFISSSYAQASQSSQASGDAGVKSSRSSIKLEDFSRLSRAIGQRILLTDPAGVVREGVLADVTADGVTMQFGSVTQQFARAQVAEAERLKDGTSDGVAKGMLFAAILGIGDVTIKQYLGGIAAFGVIGYLIDAGEDHREPLYRAPGFALHTALTSAPTVSFRIRF